MTPSWYDVLGVEPEADSDEIRAAWKRGVADLDPTDRRFRLLNKAAEVLLDEDRRAAHDLDLAADAEAEAEAEAQEEEAHADLQAGAVEDDRAVEADRSDRADEPVVTIGGPGVVAESATSSRRTPGPVLTGVLGVVALVLAVVAALSVTGDDAGAPASGGLPDTREVTAAQAAAEAAVVPVLSYDFRQLEQDKQAALSYMTPEYAAEYEQLFESIIAINAPATETVVSVEVLASGIVRTGPDLVDVLLFVNRPTVNREQTTPEIYKDQATLRMRDVGGEWLVDCLISGPGGTCED